MRISAVLLEGKFFFGLKHRALWGGKSFPDALTWLWAGAAPPSLGRHSYEQHSASAYRTDNTMVINVSFGSLKYLVVSVIDPLLQFLCRKMSFHSCHLIHSTVPANLVTKTNWFSNLWCFVYLKYISNHFLLCDILSFTKVHLGLALRVEKHQDQSAWLSSSSPSNISSSSMSRSSSAMTSLNST